MEDTDFEKSHGVRFWATLISIIHAGTDGDFRRTGSDQRTVKSWNPGVLGSWETISPYLPAVEIKK